MDSVLVVVTVLSTVVMVVYCLPFLLSCLQVDNILVSVYLTLLLRQCYLYFSLLQNHVKLGQLLWCFDILHASFPNL